MPRWSDPTVGGKYGNPGAAMHLSNKSIDQCHMFLSESLGRAIISMNVSDLNVAIGTATLIIKPPRITEAKFNDFDRDFMPPNRIRSKFYDGKIVANGEWEYKSPNIRKNDFIARAMKGIYRTTITHGELESTNQLGRTTDAKPMVQTIDCRANFSQFRVDIEGAGNHSLVENCDDPVCRKIRTYFEDLACQVFRTLVKDMINKKLATFPTLIDTYSKNQKINYGLLLNEPKVGEYDILAGLEGKSLWYGSGNVPFLPATLDFVNRNRMASFELSDFAFNTIFYQSHTQRFQYSAVELLHKSISIKNQLSLNCKSSPKSTGKNQRWGGEITTGLHVNKSCMGSIFDNDQKPQYASNDTGDMIFKSDRRAPSIIVQSKDRSYFDASNGILEIYGPTNGQDEKRQLLGRAEVRELRGDFLPKFNGANVTGSMKITKLELAQPSGAFNDQSISKLTQFAQPLLTDMFNVFFDRYAQFPIPLPDGFQCASPDFMVNNRTMQIDCDIRYVEGKWGTSSKKNKL